MFKFGLITIISSVVGLDDKKQPKLLKADISGKTGTRLAGNETLLEHGSRSTCPAGYQPESTVLVGTACTSCVAGTFSASGESCLTCDANTYSLSSPVPESCTACVGGSTSEAGSGLCYCSAKHYSWNSLTNICDLNCPPGSYDGGAAVCVCRSKKKPSTLKSGSVRRKRKDQKAVLLAVSMPQLTALLQVVPMPQLTAQVIRMIQKKMMEKKMMMIGLLELDQALLQVVFLGQLWFWFLCLHCWLSGKGLFESMGLCLILKSKSKSTNTFCFRESFDLPS